MGGACTVLDCGRKTIARGMCWTHYQRTRRGLPVDVYLRQVGRNCSPVKFGPEKPPHDVLRVYRIAWDLFNNVTFEPNTGCHLWLGEVLASGYGRIGNCRDPWGGYAHRAVLYFSGVKLERGHRLHVRHSCDNPGCVNPRHLSYGTAQENMLDRERRGRGTRGRSFPELSGEKHPRSKLSDANVAEIRVLLVAGVRGSEIARRFGVNVNTIYAIKHGRSRVAVSGLPNPTQDAA